MVRAGVDSAGSNLSKWSQMGMRMDTIGERVINAIVQVISVN